MVVAHRTRSWMKDNVLNLVIIAMIAGYFAYDLNDKRTNEDEHKVFRKELSDQGARIYNLMETYGIKSAKDCEQDKEILDLWKCQRRSGGGNETILKQK